MAVTTITMKRGDGLVDSKVHLPDASTVYPDSTGQIVVPAQFMQVMITAGYQIVVSSGTTHVP